MGLSAALRTAAATLLAVATVGIFAALVAGRDESAVPDPIGTGVLWAGTALVVVVFPGFVLFGWLRNRGLVQWWHFALAGACLGVLAQALWLLPMLFFGLLASLVALKLLLEAIGFCSVAGLLGGSAFWLVSRPRIEEPVDELNG